MLEYSGKAVNLRAVGWALIAVGQKRITQQGQVAKFRCNEMVDSEHWKGRVRSVSS